MGDVTLENSELQVAKVTNLQAEVLRNTIAAGTHIVLPLQYFLRDSGQDALTEVTAAVIHIEAGNRQGYPLTVILPVGIKYLKEVMEYEFRIREEICRGNAAVAAGYADAGRECAPHRDHHGAELECPDQLAEDAGWNHGRDPGKAGHPDHGGKAENRYGTAASDSAREWTGQPGSHGAVPADADAGSEARYRHDAGYDEISGATGWEAERAVWAGNLAGGRTDEEYFEEAVLDLSDPHCDPGHLGTDAAYLAAGLTNLIDDRPVEDSTTKHFRPERKKQKAGIVITPPFGYFKDKNTNQVEIVPEAAETIHLIFASYLSGMGLKAIARMLNEEKRKTPAQMQMALLGKRMPERLETEIKKKYLWDGTMVSRLLKDEAYTGTLICHKSERNKINKTFRFTDAAEQFRHENYLPPIITKELWEQVQELMNMRKKDNVRAG